MSIAASQECSTVSFPLIHASSALQKLLKQCEKLISEDVLANGPGTHSIFGRRRAPVAWRPASLFSIIWGAQRRRH